MTTMIASTMTGRVSRAMMKMAAITRPATTALPMLRGGAAAVLVGPAGRPERCWPGRRRIGSVGRRGIIDGSVPIVIRPGSRRGERAPRR